MFSPALDLTYEFATLHSARVLDDDGTPSAVTVCLTLGVDEHDRAEFSEPLLDILASMGASGFMLLAVLPGELSQVFWLQRAVAPRRAALAASSNGHSYPPIKAAALAAGIGL